MLTRIYLLLLFFILFSCGKPEHNTQSNILDNYDMYNKIENKETFLDGLYNQTILETNDSLNREVLLKVAARFEWLGKEQKFKKAVYKVQRLAIAQKDSSHQAKVFWYLGDYYDTKQNIDSAYYYYLKAEQLYASQRDSINWGRMLLSKAGILYDIGIYTESEIATTQALQILCNQNETRLLYEANVQMTLILKELKEHKIALNYYLKLPVLLNQLELEKYDSYQLRRSWLSYNNNIGGYYNDINQVETAKKHFEKALYNNYIDEYPRLKAMLLCNYAYNRILADANNSLIDSLLDSSLALRREINHKQGIIDGKIRIAAFSLIKQDTLNAIKIMEEVYGQALEDKSGYELIESLKFLSQYHPENKEFYYRSYLKTQDSLYNIERQTRNRFARIAYETNEIEKKNDALVKRNIYLWGIVIVIFFLSIVGFISYHFHIKNRKLLYKQKELQSIYHIQELLLQKQDISNQVRDQERKRIARDLHDGIVSNIHILRSSLLLLSTSEPEQKMRLHENLKQTEEQLRTLSHDMFKKIFENDDNFSDILKDLVLQQKNKFETDFVFVANNNIQWDYYSNSNKIQIYLILLELLHNVNKHSHASECRVILLMVAKNIIIRVCDNGIGIDNEKLITGIGYKNIKHRLKSLKGALTISKLDEMTMVVVEFPYEKNSTIL